MSVAAPAKKIIAPAKPANALVAKAEKEGKRTKRTDFPIPEGGLLSSKPEGFDPKKHNRLKPKSFSKSWMFLEYKADQLDETVKSLRAKAEARKAGKSIDPSEKAKKKANKLVSQLASLTDALKAQGVDVAALLAQAQSQPATTK